MTHFTHSCLYCEAMSSGTCRRCGAPLCTTHLHDEEHRCQLCEWFGYYSRWRLWWVLYYVLSLVLLGFVLIVTVEDNPVSALIMVAYSWAVLYKRIPERYFDGYKRRCFLKDRLPGKWYAYAIPLKRAGLLRTPSRRS
jgi:hypothetical protein